jgi:site-specific DNA-methyltransferase (adenine-specific)
MNKIYFGDNLDVLRSMDDESIDLIYIDPPFNTGKTQRNTKIKTIQDENGDRVGFQGNKYKTIKLSSTSYDDTFNNGLHGELPDEKYFAYQEIAPDGEIEYLELFLKPRLIEAHRLLKEYGSLYFHIDYREVHYVKILLDSIFGRDNFLNEIIWAYDFGGRSRSKWPAKHDNILLYVKNRDKYFFFPNNIDRIDYMAPGLVGPQKTKNGKLPTDTWWWTHVGTKGMNITDTWWMSIVGTNSKERVGYPTQKPVYLLDRIINASTLKGAIVLDFFAGSGTTGVSCLKNERNFILIDKNRAALEVMAKRFSGIDNIEWINFTPNEYQDSDGEVVKFLKEQDIPSADNSSDPDPEFLFLATRASELQETIEEKLDLWKNSPFEWILQLPARKKGKISRLILQKWFASKGIEIVKRPDSSETIIIGNKSFAIKFSTLWESGNYSFQQIKKDGPEYIICFGLSPFTAHCWVLKKEDAISNGNPQHKGADNSEYWISIDPNNVPEWAKNFGGDLEKATKVINRL